MFEQHFTVQTAYGGSQINQQTEAVLGMSSGTTGFVGVLSSARLWRKWSCHGGKRRSPEYVVVDTYQEWLLHLELDNLHVDANLQWVLLRGEGGGGPCILLRSPYDI